MRAARQRHQARETFLALLLFLSATVLDAQVPASLAMDVRDLRDRSIRWGLTLPSATLPFSATTILSTLDRLPPDSTEDARPSAAAWYQTLRESDVSLIDFDLVARYEQFFRPSHPLDLQELLRKIDPLAVLTFSYQYDRSIVLYVDAILQNEYSTSDPANNIWTPASGNPVALENNNVRAGYLAIDRDPFEIIIGRHDVTIGPSPLTSLVIAPDVPFLDSIDFKLDLGPLRMSMLVSTLENREAASDVVLTALPYEFGSTVILHNIHYFEYSFDRFRLGIGGQVIITREGNAFQASDFFPVFSWHQADIIPNNLTLTLDASWIPFRGVEFYAQLGFDDINTAGIGSNDATIPTIPAGLFGASWSLFTHGITVDVITEAGWTHYLWGTFEDDCPLSRAIYRMNLDGNDQWLPLNSPYGPGTTWILLDVLFDTPVNLFVQLSARLLWRKVGVDLAITPYADDPTLQAAPMLFSLHSVLTVAYTPFPWLRLTLEPEMNFEAGDFWLELGIGAGTHLEARGRVR